LIDENFDASFVIRADAHDSSSVGTDDFPPEMMREADGVAEEIKELIRTFNPIFPAAEIQKKVKEFICRVLGAIYNIDRGSPRHLHDVFHQMRESTADDIPALISQTQFVDTMFREAIKDQNYEVLGVLWRNYGRTASIH
jgi:hypothetical protein